MSTEFCWDRSECYSRKYQGFLVQDWVKDTGLAVLIAKSKRLLYVLLMRSKVMRGIINGIYFFFLRGVAVCKIMAVAYLPLIDPLAENPQSTCPVKPAPLIEFSESSEYRFLTFCKSAMTGELCLGLGNLKSLQQLHRVSIHAYSLEPGRESRSLTCTDSTRGRLPSTRP